MTIPKPPNSEAQLGAADTSPERRAEIEEIFDEALDMPEEDRAAWLASRCGDDAALRRSVELLLAAHEQHDSPLDIPAAVHAASMFANPARGRRIGPYRVLRELGRGGMGVVYLAERDDGQFKRRVAVKVLRASQDAGELHQRFLAERQILASLNHPHIAQLLDGGVSDGQLPYLVIEYVDGLPITEYCDRQKLDIPSRLRLFREVCGAVHHAHQNLVLHRDLKPGNVLVTSTGEVKLLDFGIAKLLNPSLAAVEQPVTRTAFRLMTPAYASPEQVRGDTLTTASDVYALGLLLYELIAGRPAHRITTNSPREVFQVVCERDAERPSDAVVNVEAGGASPAELAAARGTTPERLRRQLRGDLDAIVAMALRKEAGRRYGSAELVAADVGRFLDGLPVLAHRGSRGYRFEKFVRRHRAAATIAASSAVVLIVAAGVAFRMAAVATRERDRSAVALAQTQDALRESEAVTNLLVGLFRAGNPLEGGHAALTATDLLRRGVAAAEKLEGEPAAQARTFEALGRVYTIRGDLELGADLLRRALAIRQTKLAGDDLSAATTTAALADVLRQQGKYAAADTLARVALRVRRAALGDAHPDVAESLDQVAGMAIYLGNLADAEAHALDAVAVWRRTGRGRDARMVGALERLSSIVWRRGDDAGAERPLREALTIVERASPDLHEAHSGVLMRLADLLAKQPDRRAEAESLARASVRVSRDQSGDAHPVTANAVKQLGIRLAEFGKTAEAERLMREALMAQRRVWGDSNIVVGATMLSLAEILTQRGNLAEAERIASDAVAIHAASLGTNHSTYAGALGVLVDALVARGALDSAEVVARRALDVRIASVGPTQTLTALTAAGLAGVLARQRRFEEADSIYRSAVAVIRRRTTESHVDTRSTYAGMAAMFEAWGKPDSAARYRRLAEPPRAGTR